MQKLDNGHVFHLSVSVVSTITHHKFDHDQYPKHPFYLHSNAHNLVQNHQHEKVLLTIINFRHDGFCHVMPGDSH